MQIKKEKKHAKFRFSFVLLFIFASFAACFALYMNGDGDDAVFVSNSHAAETPDDAADNTYEVKTSVINPVPKSARAQEDHFERSLIIAEEQMRGLSDYGVVPRDNLYTGEFTPADIAAESVVSFLTGKDYENLYIMFGADSAVVQDFESLSGLVTEVIQNRENVKIYLVSAIPLKAENESETLSNAEIEGFNSLLLNFANENNVNYIDLNTYLIGNDGKLPSSKAESVGDRLKKDTYLEIADFLLTHIA